jgi:hypothetical protein
MAERREETPFRSGSDGEPMGAARKQACFGDLGCRGVISFTVACF